MRLGGGQDLGPPPHHQAEAGAGPCAQHVAGGVGVAVGAVVVAGGVPAEAVEEEVGGDVNALKGD